MNIAIFSPSQNPYSETFIQAHKLYLKDTVYYYYGNLGRMFLENGTLDSGKIRSLWWQFKQKLNRAPKHTITVKHLQRSLKRLGIDVILVEYGTHAYHLLPLLESAGIPFVVHFHGYDASRFEAIERCDYYKGVFAIASKVVSVSHVMSQKLLELGCPKDKLVYNVYGPRPEFQEVKAAYSKSQFISIGRFTDKKAPYYTILAFKEVVKTYPHAKLLMAGDGVLLEACKNLVTYYHLDSHVEFLGVISADVYKAYLSESLGFVQHSITAMDGDMEGTPLAVLEASAAGLPVVSTHHAGISDVVVHEQTGLLCSEHDVLGMAENMKRLLNDKSFSKDLGQAGKLRVAEHFNLDRHINGLQTLLSDLNN